MLHVEIKFNIIPQVSSEELQHITFKNAYVRT
jgi:hypothetical protein